MKYFFSFCFVLFFTGLSYAQSNDARLQQRAEKSAVMTTQQNEKNAVRSIEKNLERYEEAVRIDDTQSAQVLRKTLVDNYAALTDARIKLNPSYKSSIEPAKLNKVKNDDEFMQIVRKAVQ